MDQKQDYLIFTAWKAGGYGFKTRICDRDKYFKKEWQNAVIELPKGGSYEEVVCNISEKSFWKETCHELIKKEIGIWLKTNGYINWPKWHPYKFRAMHLAENRFRLVGLVQENNEKTFI